MKMRRGDYSHMAVPDEVGNADHTQFLGCYVAGAAVSFIIFWFFLGIVITPLCLPLIWKTLYDNLFVIAGLAVMPIIQGVCQSIAIGKIIADNYVFNRR